jgi:hypothetical protein
LDAGIESEVRSRSRAVEHHGLTNTADQWRDHGNAFLATINQEVANVKTGSDRYDLWERWAEDRKRQEEQKREEKK